jgi:hypothetical protein
VGSYRSHFEAIFAQRTPPPRLKLIEHVLPLRRAAIDRRTEAVSAAQDALETAREFYARGQIGPDLVSARLSDLARQQTAFLEAVRDYNCEIAEYACGVAAQNTTPATLVTMMIRHAVPPSAAATAASKTPEGERRSAEDVLRQSLLPRQTPKASRMGVPTPAAPRQPEARNAPSPTRSIVSETGAPELKEAETPETEPATPRYPDDLQPPPRREFRFKPTDDDEDDTRARDNAARPPMPKGWRGCSNKRRPHERSGWRHFCISLGANRARRPLRSHWPRL